jgi:hypothetical protein
MMLIGLERFTKTDNINTKKAQQLIAQKLIEENRYCAESKKPRPMVRGF